MAKGTRGKQSASFKAKVVLSALTGAKTLTELAQQFEVHQITDWKRQLSNCESNLPIDVKAMHAKIGATDAGKRFFDFLR